MRKEQDDDAVLETDEIDARMSAAAVGVASEEELLGIDERAEYLDPPVDLRSKAPERKRKRGEKEPVEAAEAALERMSKSFEFWMADETGRLAALWAEAEEAGYDEQTRDAFYRAAHDIKGQAATLGFPLAGRVAASLCRLLDSISDGERLPRPLVRQHVQSVRAMVSELTREEITPTAQALAERLDEVTRDFLSQIDHAA